MRGSRDGSGMAMAHKVVPDTLGAALFGAALLVDSSPSAPVAWDSALL